MYGAVRRRKLLRGGNGHRNATITTATRMRRITIVPTQVWGKRNMSLSQRTLIRRTKHTIRRVNRRIWTRGRRHVECFVHEILMADYRHACK